MDAIIRNRNIYFYIFIIFEIKKSGAVNLIELRYEGNEV
jgi:hypothetical protein